MVPGVLRERPVSRVLPAAVLPALPGDESDVHRAAAPMGDAAWAEPRWPAALEVPGPRRPVLLLLQARGWAAPLVALERRPVALPALRSPARTPRSPALQTRPAPVPGRR